MSRIMEEIWERGFIKGQINSIKALLINGFTLEEALDALDIPLDEREMYIQRVMS